MYREESVSSSFSSVNGRSRGAVDRKVRVNGATLREKIRTKDGKITKAKAQMRKSASALSPEALYFFRNEMQKEAIFTPQSAMKAIGYSRPGLFGNMVRKAGEVSWNAQSSAQSYMQRFKRQLDRELALAKPQLDTIRTSFDQALVDRTPTPPTGKIGRMIQSKSPDLYETMRKAKNRVQRAALREMYLGARPAAAAAQKALLIAPVLGPSAALQGLGTDAALHMVRRTGMFPRLTNATSMVNNVNEAFSVGDQLIDMARPFV